MTETPSDITHQTAAGPPARRPRKRTELYNYKYLLGHIEYVNTYRTPPMKFSAQKLAAKFSMKCQLR